MFSRICLCRLENTEAERNKDTYNMLFIKIAIWEHSYYLLLVCISHGIPTKSKSNPSMPAFIGHFLILCINQSRRPCSATALNFLTHSLPNRVVPSLLFQLFPTTTSTLLSCQNRGTDVSRRASYTDENISGFSSEGTARRNGQERCHRLLKIPTKWRLFSAPIFFRTGSGKIGQ